MLRQLDQAIDQALADKRIVGTVVTVVRDGETFYRRAAGFADREAAKPMREDSLFRLSSISKPYVTAAAMQLVERGAMSIDDPVTRWLPDFRPQLADGARPIITIRQLLTHTSGLGYTLTEKPGGEYHRLRVASGLGGDKVTLTENMRRLGQTTLLAKPGTQWIYSMSTDVLGAVIAAVTGESLPAAVDRNLLRPLGLHDTAFHAKDPTRLAVAYGDGKPEPVRMADGHELKVPPEGVATYHPSHALDPDGYPSGGGGMVGTSGDFVRFLEAVRSGGAPILKADTVATMMMDQVGPQAMSQGPGWGFGYGWAVLDDSEAAATPQAKGTIKWGGAYGHNWWIDSTNRLTVVALTNTAFEGMWGRYTIDVRDAIYAELPPK